MFFVDLAGSLYGLVSYLLGWRSDPVLDPY